MLSAVVRSRERPRFRLRVVTDLILASGCATVSDRKLVQAKGWQVMSLVAASKPRREDLPPGANLCEHCTAKCCRYFALPIDTPDSHEEFEYIRWYLLHERASVFVEDEVWYLLVHTVCRHLQDDHRCGIYDTRPTICQEYSTDDCEYEDTWSTLR